MQVNKFIDHTLLKAFATKDDIAKLCDEAKKYDFKSVCVNPARVKEAKENLKFQAEEAFLFSNMTKKIKIIDKKNNQIIL